jgi:hypothetical protein
MSREAEDYIANITNFITALMAIKRHLHKDGAPSTFFSENYCNGFTVGLQ